MAFSDLFTSITQPDYLVELRARLTALSVPILQWLSTRNTGLALTMYVSEALSKLDARRAAILRACFLDTAEGDGLTKLAKSHFGLDRLERRFTVGKVLLQVVVGAGPHTITAGSLLVGTAGAQGKTFTSLDGGQLDPAVNGGRLVVTVQCTTPGAGGNVPLNSIVELKSPLTGVTVSNPDFNATGTWITSAGSDGEYGVNGQPNEAGDISLRRRCDLRWAVAGETYELPDGRVVVVIASGTADAYEFWARYPLAGGNSSPVTKAKVLPNWANGGPLPQAVTVIIAGSAGALPPADVAAVRATYENPAKYPLGTKLFVQSARARIIPLIGTINVRGGHVISAVAAQVLEHVIALQARLGIGERLYLTAIIEALQGANPAAIRDVVLTAPAADVAVAFDEIVTLDPNQLAFVQVP